MFKYTDVPAFAAQSYEGNRTADDPDAMLTNTDGDSLDLPSPFRCGSIGSWLDTNYPPCAGSSTSHCMMPD